MISYIAGIVTYNRYDKLLSAIESLLNQTILPKYIIVIDNASTDVRYSNLKEQYYNSKVPIIIKRQESNLGGSGGFTQLFKEAKKSKSEFLLLSDDDIVYHQDYVEQISKHDLGKKHVYVGRAIDNKGMTLALHYPVKFQGELSKIKTITFLGVLLPVIAIREVGLPIADFFIWEDDREYAQRLEKKGNYKFVGVNKAVVFHNSGLANIGPVKSDWKTYYGIRNFIYRVKLHENDIFGWNRVFWKLAKSIGVTFILPKRYNGNIKYRIGQIFNGAVDGMHGKLGINKKYFPGKR